MGLPSRNAARSSGGSLTNASDHQGRHRMIPPAISWECTDSACREEIAVPARYLNVVELSVAYTW